MEHADRIASTSEPLANSSILTLREQLRPALISVLLLTLVTGAGYPLALMLVGRLAFSRQANGSLIERDGKIVGSELIGQNFNDERYFDPRPSAAGKGYDATNSGGTNLSPSNPKLRNGEPESEQSQERFIGVRELAEAYRRRNGLTPEAVVPIDAVTRSGSGLDPHISPANAKLQAARVARARGLGADDVLRLVSEHTEGRQLGFLGDPRVNVLALNLALDRLAPPPARR
jgi:K+-transporting ATPase ATPase C chain